MCATLSWPARRGIAKRGLPISQTISPTPTKTPAALRVGSVAAERAAKRTSEPRGSIREKLAPDFPFAKARLRNVCSRPSTIAPRRRRGALPRTDTAAPCFRTIRSHRAVEPRSAFLRSLRAPGAGASAEEPPEAASFPDLAPDASVVPAAGLAPSFSPSAPVGAALPAAESPS
jgi:hypothetical protein